MKTAVIKTGGKQYLVSEGQEILVEKDLPATAKSVITFSDVLLVATDKTVNIGDPLLAGAVVEAKIISQTKSRKVHGVKMKAKKRNRQYFGHRQPQTRLAITKITVS